MKFIVDECTGRRVADFLKEEGFDTKYVSETDPQATDTEIMEKAFAEDRIIITNDKDFGRKTVKEGENAEGVLLLRLKIETPKNKVKAVQNVIENHKDKLQGNLAIAREDQIKLRKLD